MQNLEERMSLYNIYSCDKCNFQNTWRQNFDRHPLNPLRKQCPKCKSTAISLLQGPDADFLGYSKAEDEEAEVELVGEE
jgi:hypothetical protein